MHLVLRKLSFQESNAFSNNFSFYKQSLNLKKWFCNPFPILKDAQVPSMIRFNLVIGLKLSGKYSLVTAGLKFLPVLCIRDVCKHFFCLFASWLSFPRASCKSS